MIKTHPGRNKSFPSRKKIRQLTAERLGEERAQRSSKEQLHLLDSRFGKGIGAKKERTRLLSQIEKENQPTKVEKQKKKNK